MVCFHLYFDLKTNVNIKGIVIKNERNFFLKSHETLKNQFQKLLQVFKYLIYGHIFLSLPF